MKNSIKNVNNIFVGTKIVVIVARTINGPNGIYPSSLFFLAIIIIMLITAPIKNDNTDIITTEYEDKFTSLGQVIYYTKVRLK